MIGDRSCLKKYCPWRFYTKLIQKFVLIKWPLLELKINLEIELLERKIKKFCFGIYLSCSAYDFHFWPSPSFELHTSWKLINYLARPSGDPAPLTKTSSNFYKADNTSLETWGPIVNCYLWNNKKRTPKQNVHVFAFINSNKNCILPTHTKIIYT